MRTSGDEAAQAEIAAFLEDPATHGGATVERVDTHIAAVFLAGDRAYKLKKAVRLPYVDFTDLEARRAACERELALNRLSAPEIYLDMVPVLRGPDGALRLGSDPAPESDEILDWLVVMRRFDQAALLDRLALEGALDEETVVTLADAVVDLHARSEVVAQADPVGALGAILEESLDELAGRQDLFGAEPVARLARLSRTALDGQAELIRARAEAGRVRRCHGDLHLRNIVLWQGRPTIFDALEFDDDLATADVFYDLAYLLMDMEHRRVGSLACRLLSRYLVQTTDDEGAALLPLCLAMRAMIRAKIWATMEEGAEDEAARRAARTEAATYLEGALGDLERPKPVLVAMGGLSGSGKSRLAYALAPHLGARPGAVVVRSDEERKRLFDVSIEAPLAQEAYAAGVSDRVYDRLHARAAELLAAGHSVILDAAHLEPARREDAEATTGRAGVPFLPLWLEAPAPVLRERLGGRTHDASDADIGVLEGQLGADLGSIGWTHLDARGSVAEILAAALAVCREKGFPVRPAT